MSLRWLAEDDAHPGRPAPPLVRHSTFAEARAFEPGAYIGLLAYFGVRVGQGGAILTLLIGIVRFVTSDGRAKVGATKAVHGLGFHGVRQEPPYSGVGFLLAVAAAAIGVRVLRVLELGPIA